MLLQKASVGLRQHHRLLQHTQTHRCRRICTAAAASSIREVQQGLKSGQLTAVGIIDQYSEAIVNSEPVVNSLLSVQFEGAVRKVCVGRE